MATAPAAAADDFDCNLACAFFLVAVVVEPNADDDRSRNDAKLLTLNLLLRLALLVVAADSVVARALVSVAGDEVDELEEVGGGEEDEEVADEEEEGDDDGDDDDDEDEVEAEKDERADDLRWSMKACLAFRSKADVWM
ncbi:hypothetical protein BGZ72_001299 [Mortierella alpina]|nr:hypothetical protein BGZ72_001299 [Mortierella alpina]